jgi:hypothetical protein
MRLLIATCILVQCLAVHPAFARPSIGGTAVTNIGDIGEHYPLFLVEKSYHPQNIAVVYTKLDRTCHVMPDHAHGSVPTLDFYWLMDATRYKPMARALKESARQHLQFIDSQEHQGYLVSFTVRSDALARLHHDLQSPTVQIKTKRQGEACVATAYVTLGPSDGNVTIQVESVYARTADLTMFKALQAMADPNAIQIDAVTVKGTDIATGQPIERTYPAIN